MEKSEDNRPKLVFKKKVKENNVTPSNHNVGILKESLDVLALMQLKNCPQICALIIHEKTLNQKSELYKDKIWGYNEGLTQNNETLLEEKLAKKAITLMVVSLEENWKIPIGIFFVDSFCNISNLADTIKETLTQLNEIGIHIICVSMDCLADYKLALAKHLGWKTDMNSITPVVKPTFKHPHCGTVSIYFQLLPLVDNLKDYWTSNTTLLYKNDMIHYDLVEYAKRIKTNDLPKHTSQISDDWTVIQKRLNYDEENISKTVANALEYLMQIHHPDFEMAQPTITFIKMLEFVQSLADEARIGQLEICSMNPDFEDHWRPLIVKYSHYLRDLKKVTVDTPSHLSTFKVCVTGIRASLHSLLNIYSNHICGNNKSKKNTNPVISLPTRLDTNNVNVMINIAMPTALNIYKQITSLATRTHLITEN